jgi:hypothetical protein
MTKSMTPSLLATVLLAAAAVAARAEEFAVRDREHAYFDPWVQFINMTVAPRDAKTATVRFDIRWEDSWRNDHNHDVAWVFLKVRAAPQSEWQHVRLAADRVLNPSGFGQAPDTPRPPATNNALPYYQGRPAESKVGGFETNPDLFPTPGAGGSTRLEFLAPGGDDGFTGVFIRRAEAGGGTVTARGVTLVCDLTSLKGIADFSKAQVRPFGLAMVYVVEGPFYLGAGGWESGSFYAFGATGNRAPPYLVTSAGAIPTGRQPGRLWSRPGAQPEDGGEIPATFPNGYRAFYCMKKHITNRNWCQFLETLTAAQSDARYCAEAGRVERHGTAPNYTYKFHLGGGRDGAAMRHLSWEDGVSYAAWAGLRPMTELELEKAIRGFRVPMIEEVGPSYWGIAGIGHWPWDSIKSWETHCERAVTVGNARGRTFKGTHGLGTLALPADWPQADAVGSGRRYTHVPGLEQTRVSDRLVAAVADVAREGAYKFRCVRTAPKEACVSD